MKWIITLCVLLCAAMTGFAQDTTGTKSDTIKVGGMIILRKGGGDDTDRSRRGLGISRRRNYNKSSNVSTNWWILDLGFSNYSDKTNYPNTAGMTAATVDKDAMKLRSWKSRNVNLWFFMQKLNLIKHAVNLKYGLGLELNNYFYDQQKLTFQKNPTFIYVSPIGSDSLKKNKLAADYLTLPAMLNFNFTSKRGSNYGLSFGVSAGYLYSSRWKIKTDDGDVKKLHDDFNLEKWKISYVGELLIGQVKLYGSYATKSMWEKGLDQTPYTVGFRFSNW